ncbi:protease pro-enzyme activation domain-containing protein [Curtobacterium sp. MCLR17_034]|uniref:S53 family peptidase n=1 Tax=Curtobacterium sp. MCLR17_034 TaxID=2175623 RepID=UPI0021AC439C|nr:S53 family peptidase [Curtobacterium sp. MCLR17_034]
MLFVAGPADAAVRQTLPNSTPSWATVDNELRKVTASTDVEGEVFLPLQNQRGAEAFATAVSTPGSTHYRKPLSPAAWIKRYAPSRAAVDQVAGFLRAKGLRITAVPASHQFVLFRGPASVVNSALGVSLHTYKHAGQSLVAPSTVPSLPTSIARRVSGVSVDQGRLLTHPDLVRQGETPPSAMTSRPLAQESPAATGVAARCSRYDGEHTAVVPAAYGKTRVHTFACGYVPKQIRSAYGLDALAARGVQGQRQTVAIIGAYASPTIVRDTNSYSAQHGEPPLTSSTFQQLIPSPSEFTDKSPCQQPSGWQGEETLDVQSVHAVAPAAKILYVGGTNCGGGMDVAVSNILDQGLANIVNNSYGDVGENLALSVIRGQENLHIQAAGEGIGMYFSSGDNGDERASLGSAQPDFPASSPWVTSVGGTSIGIGKNGRRTFETGWGDALNPIVSSPRGNVYSKPLPGDISGAGGGGQSTLFDQPAYQRGIVPAYLAGGKRVSPDIAAIASPYTGFSIGYRPISNEATLATSGFVNETTGGTSLAAPVTAAISALVQQSTHTRLGFANPTLYATYRATPSAFRDVRPSAAPIALAYTSKPPRKDYLVTLDHDTSLTTAPGYDDETGLGAVSFTEMTQVARR